MSVNSRVLRCTPDDVFAVLADGWLFPAWVVGASRMREVSDTWPHAGGTLDHSFGVWPALINDRTTVMTWDPPTRMVMRPKGWPIGVAEVIVEVEPHPRGTKVIIREKALSGAALLVPSPLLHAGLYLRNIETLHRLAYLSEGGAGDNDRRPEKVPPKRAGDAPDRSAGRHPVVSTLLGALKVAAVGGAVLAVLGALHPSPRTKGR